MRPVPAHVQAVAALLSPVLAGADFDDAMRAVREYAHLHGMTQPKVGSSKQYTFIGRDVVVKRGYTVATLDSVPEEFRPEQVVVWQEAGDDYRPDQIVVQPRYHIPQDEFGFVEPLEMRQRLRESSPTIAERGEFFISPDAHFNNWGFREDGSPVLFDY